ncbi:MAG: polysaccharide deacetylase family protein [Prevotellaceae bacterium]|jgi:alpha-amylase|nr:polysaccharide deacetylase family protein [Prevotellaceae bacterium]
MDKTICLYFQVHQPLRLRQYRFFDIGLKHDYYDEFANRSIMRKVANRCYLPMNRVLMELISEHGKAFKVSFSISGMAIEQFEKYAPEVLDSFRELAQTGCVEWLSETYPHSLASLQDPSEFEAQVREHKKTIESHFGQTPVAFRNTELIYSDAIGQQVADMGYTTMLIEGARHVLGWKSPNFIYTNPQRPKLKLLLKNYRLSDDIAFRFSDRAWDQWPLTAEKYAGWLLDAASKGDIVNLFMDYETFGEHQCAETGIFAFFRYLPEQIFAHSDFAFLTPSEATQKHLPIAPLHVPYPISWADEERDTSAWLGNELQNEAFTQLYKLSEKIHDNDLLHEFRCLQASDHFYYMCTKFFSDGAVHKYFNPYATPYEAFINYMNILSDFTICVDNHFKKSAVEDAVAQEKPATAPNNLNTTVNGKKQRIKKTAPKKAVVEEPKPVKTKALPKKTAVKNAAPKKAAVVKKETPKKATPKKK